MGYLLLLLFRVSLSLVLIYGVFSYQQSDYILTTERAVVVSYNAEYLVPSIRFFKFNRTYTALNFTLDFKRNLGNDVWVKIKVYKFLSNVYRFFGVEFARGLCDAFKNNEFGVQNLYKCGNFSGCPIQKMHCFICNWGPDYAKFPPYMLTGQFRMDFTYIHSSVEFAVIEWYVKVSSTKPF